MAAIVAKTNVAIPLVHYNLLGYELLL